jgi:hypothetical protein
MGGEPFILLEPGPRMLLQHLHRFPTLSNIEASDWTHDSLPNLFFSLRKQLLAYDQNRGIVALLLCG